MPKVPVGFLNGHASRKDALGVLAFPHRLSSNDEFCRFFSYINGRWGAMDLPFQARALTSQREPERAWWILGKNGEVTALTARGRRDESIPGAGLNVASPYGHLCNIRMIAGSLYACGDGRQVYKRDDDQWRCMSNEILTHDTARGFFDIDGFSADQLYAVGWHGEIYYFDGHHWHKDESPTPMHLAAVRCTPAGTVWICGDKGTLLKGCFNRWEVIEDSACTENWYDLTLFEGRVYLAGNTQLACYDGSNLTTVDTGLNRSFSTHRLSASEGILWSIGEDDILRYENGQWQEIIHPDNA